MINNNTMANFVGFIQLSTDYFLAFSLLAKKSNQLYHAVERKQGQDSLRIGVKTASIVRDTGMFDGTTMWISIH